MLCVAYYGAAFNSCALAWCPRSDSIITLLIPQLQCCSPEVTMPKDCLHDYGTVEHRDVHNTYGFYHVSTVTLLVSSPALRCASPVCLPRLLALLP